MFLSTSTGERSRFFTMNNKSEKHISYVKETYGVIRRNIYTLFKNSVIISVNSEHGSHKQWQSLNCFLMSVFLPHGYPDSVSKDYLQYQIWDSIQAFASSITGSICTHAVLKGAGVGDKNASALAATITWLIKDGSSMVGRITFAWLKGTQLDRDCKKWRLFADIMNDIAMFLDLLSAYFQNYFTLIICLSGLLKSIVGVAGGSTRAALTQHQARKNNMADVSAKDGSQETLVNLLALICSLAFIPIVTKSFVLTWMLYILMTIIHVTANYFAVKSVVMETFNTTRFRILGLDYIMQKPPHKHLLSVGEVNKRENVFFSVLPQKTVIKLGTSFKEIVEGRSCKEIENLFKLYENCDYILSFELGKNSSKAIIKVVLNHKATVMTEMEAMLQACFIDFAINNSGIKVFGDNLLSKSRDYVKAEFNDFLKCAEIMGFNVKVAFFDTDMWRVDW